MWYYIPLSPLLCSTLIQISPSISPLLVLPLSTPQLVCTFPIPFKTSPTKFCPDVSHKKFFHSHESHGNLASPFLSVTKLYLSFFMETLEGLCQWLSHWWHGSSYLCYTPCYLLTNYVYLLTTFPISCFCLLVSKLVTQYSHSNQIFCNPGIHITFEFPTSLQSWHNDFNLNIN